MGVTQGWMDGLGLPRMRGTLKGAYKKHVGILWLFKRDLSGRV